MTRVKILKKPGYDAATVEIPLYHRDGAQEQLTNLRGFPYRLVNGQVQKTKLETSGAFLEKRGPARPRGASRCPTCARAPWWSTPTPSRRTFW